MCLIWKNGIWKCNIQVQNIFNLFVVDLYNIRGMGVIVMWGINAISFVSSGAISVEYHIIGGELFE